MLGPTDRQREETKDLHGNIALVQFQVIQEQSEFEHYRSASGRAVIEAGGKRTHDMLVDQILAGGELKYQAITIDLFPSGQAALNAFEPVSSERLAALSEVYALLVRPRANLSRIAKSLGVLSPLLRRWLGTDREKEMNDFAAHANPETGPIPETVDVMREHEQSKPFYMMNLNRYYVNARYENGEDITGEQAYNRYGSRILPYLISVGGYLSIIGPFSAVFVGNENSQLHDDWSDFAMVYYPSRRNFIRMMSNSPSKGVYHREAGLQRAVLMPCTSFPNSLQNL